jgi:hypothetical protein
MNLSMACDLNNLAIAKLKQSGRNEAMRLLRIAVTTLKGQLVQDTKHFCEENLACPELPRQVSSVDHESLSSRRFNADPNDSSCTNDGRDGYIGLINSEIDEQPALLLSIPIWARDELASIEGQSPVDIYDRALHIVTHEGSIELLCAVAIYNMALTFHIAGLEANRHLAGAMKLYETVLEMIRAHHDTLPDIAGLLLLAVYNNMAHIHSLHSCLDEAEKSLHALRQVLDTRLCCKLVNKDDYFFFTLSTMTLLQHASSAA